jgi:hypothetical protein
VTALQDVFLPIQSTLYDVLPTLESPLLGKWTHRFGNPGAVQTALVSVTRSVERDRPGQEDEVQAREGPPSARRRESSPTTSRVWHRATAARLPWDPQPTRRASAAIACERCGGIFGRSKCRAAKVTPTHTVGPRYLYPAYRVSVRRACADTWYNKRAPERKSQVVAFQWLHVFAGHSRNDC